MTATQRTAIIRALADALLADLERYPDVPKSDVSASGTARMITGRLYPREKTDHPA